MTEPKLKKPRKPFTEEHKQKLREAAQLRKPRTAEHRQKLREAAVKRNAAAALAKHREKAWSPEARANRELKTKACTFLTEELYPLLLKLDRATRDPRIMSLLALDAELCAQLKEWNGEIYVTFAKSAKQLTMKHGKAAYAIWQKLFVCIQQGGKNKQGDGFPSIWAMNNDAISDYLAEHTISQSRRGRPPTISEAVEMLLPHDSLRRVWADWDIKLMNDDGYEHVEVVGKGSKIVTTAQERAALREVRKQIGAEAREAKAALREVKIAEGV